MSAGHILGNRAFMFKYTLPSEAHMFVLVSWAQWLIASQLAIIKRPSEASQALPISFIA
jgi:hypothetical protein